MKLFSLIVGGHQVLPYICDTSGVAIGNHTFKVVVDPINNNTEPDKDNNVRSITVTVLAPVGEVDMVVLAVSSNPLSPYVGDHVEITATIRNNGTAKAINVTVLFSYIINANNIGFDDQVTASISPGETVTLNSTWTTGTLAPGNYVLNITIDPLNELHERNRSNNYRTMATSLQPKVWPGTPNLRISSIITDPQKPEEGKKVKVLVTIKNTGDRDATSVRVVLFVDGVELGSQTLTTPITKNGGSQVAYFNWTPKLGLHEVKAQVYIGTSAMPDDVSSKVIKASEPSATGGSYVPVLLIIIILIIIAIALVAMGRTGGAASDSVDEGQEDEGTGEEE
jgi:subtilase family serine protease